MQAVFGFIKNLICMGFKNVGGDLLAAVGGQGMLHYTVRLGQRHAGCIQAEAVEIPAAALGFALHAHAGPHIGEQNISVTGGFVRGGGQLKVVAIFPRKEEHIGGGTVAVRAGNGKVHAHHQAAHDQAVGHVVAIAHKTGFQPGQFALVLPHRHQVSQHLQGMGIIGHAGNYRHAAVPGQGVHITLLKGAVHNSIVIAAQHAGGILDRLAAGNLHVSGAQIGAKAAHLVDANLQAGAGAGGMLAKHQGNGLALQILGVSACFVQALVFIGDIQNVDNLIGGQAA